MATKTMVADDLSVSTQDASEPLFTFPDDHQVDIHARLGEQRQRLNKVLQSPVGRDLAKKSTVGRPAGSSSRRLAAAIVKSVDGIVSFIPNGMTATRLSATPIPRPVPVSSVRNDRTPVTQAILESEPRAVPPRIARTLLRRVDIARGHPDPFGEHPVDTISAVRSTT